MVCAVADNVGDPVGQELDALLLRLHRIDLVLTLDHELVPLQRYLEVACVRAPSRKLQRSLRRLVPMIGCDNTLQERVDCLGVLGVVGVLEQRDQISEEVRK